MFDLRRIVGSRQGTFQPDPVKAMPRLHFPLPAATSRSRTVRRVLLFVVAALICLMLAFLAAAEYRPAWYVPINLTDEQLKGVRINATRLVDEIGDRLALRESYELVLSAQQLNEWLAGIAGIWPEASRRIPSELIQPVVAVNDGGLKIAARLESKGWRAIVSTDCVINLSSDEKDLMVGIGSVRLGAVPVPRWLLSRMFEPIRWGEKGESFADFHDGGRLKNEFVWPNGRRRFRIRELRFQSGRIHIQLEPL